MSEKTTTKTLVFGGNVIQSPEGVKAISWYQHEPEQFESLEAAQRWLLQRMDAEMNEFLGGMIRQLPNGRVVAVSNHQPDASIHNAIGEAEDWLLEQTGGSVEPGADWE
jgi:hypothetical protein